jgi:hypothetical protein
MSAAAEMPKYQCHKQVWALKIKEIHQAAADKVAQNDGGDWVLVPEEARFAPIIVGHYDYYDRHRPEVGGYYVVYQGGYKSYSPASAFESGYTRV